VFNLASNVALRSDSEEVRFYITQFLCLDFGTPIVGQAEIFMNRFGEKTETGQVSDGPK
jgi:hypothetical protein